MMPFLVLLSSEVIYRDSFTSTLHWMISYPNQFIVTYAILFGLMNIFFLLPRRLYIACATLFLALFSTAALVSRQKLLLRGEPLLPWDFLLGKEALTISQSVEEQNSPEITFFLAFILIAVIILISLFIIPKEKYHVTRKIFTVVLSAGLSFRLPVIFL
jgi:hypothetical protein